MDDNEKNLYDMLEKHFKEDEVRFNKLTELETINGGHLSFFNKNLEEVKGMLTEQNKVNLEQQTTLVKHIERVEPMLSSYEEDTQFNRNFGIRAKKWGIRITMLSAIIASLLYIRNFIISIFIK